MCGCSMLDKSGVLASEWVTRGTHGSIGPGMLETRFLFPASHVIQPTEQAWVAFSWGLCSRYCLACRLSGSMGSFTYFFSFLWASEDCSIKDLGMGTTEGPTTGKDEDWLCSPAVS